MKSIYELAFSESERIGNYEVMRVPGGWIFLHYGGSGKCAVFVPFHNEFDDRPYEPEVRPFLG
jgi:hypothetical protein